MSNALGARVLVHVLIVVSQRWVFSGIESGALALSLFVPRLPRTMAPQAILSSAWRSRKADL